MKSIEIPGGVAHINQLAFCHCISLENVKINEGVKIFFEGAFNACTSLKSVELPSTVTSIQLNTFQGCTSLESVYCKAKAAPKLGEKVFDNISPAAKIYVPMESVDAYKKADGWKTYANMIEGYNF